jgi:hypothetical protein
MPDLHGCLPVCYGWSGRPSVTDNIITMIPFYAKFQGPMKDEMMVIEEAIDEPEPKPRSTPKSRLIEVLKMEKRTGCSYSGLCHVTNYAMPDDPVNLLTIQRWRKDGAPVDDEAAKRTWLLVQKRVPETTGRWLASEKPKVKTRCMPPPSSASPRPSWRLTRLTCRSCRPRG